MDIFAHAAWTNIVFYKKYKNERLNRFLAIIFGVLPDLASFAPVFIYGIFSRKEFFDLIGSNIWVVNFASESYKYTHSIVVFVFVVLVIAVVRKFLNKNLIYWPMFGWALHILIDIPTHKNFYETPFLFPLSGYKFGHGISWGHPTFMIINYSVLALFYIAWVLYRNKRLSRP